MPIGVLFNEIATRFEETVARQLDLAMRTLAVLEKWVEKRIEGTERIEFMTRAYPVFVFRDEALTVSIHAMQRGALLTVPQAGFLDGMAAAGAAFVDGVTDAHHMTREAYALPDLFRSLARAIAAIDASVQRFMKPDRTLFDPSQRSAGDLFGLAALGWRALASSTDQITSAGGVLQRAFGDRGGGSNNAPGGPGANTPAAPTILQKIDGMSQKFERISHYVGAALLALPAVGAMIGPIIEAAVIRIKVEVLSRLSRVEAKLLKGREDVVNGIWNAGYYAVIGAAAWLSTVEVVVKEHVAFAAKFAALVVQAMVDQLHYFALDLVNLWDDIGGIIRSVTDWIALLMNAQVGGIVKYILTVIKQDYDELKAEQERLSSKDKKKKKKESSWKPPETFDITLGQLLDPDVGPKRKELSELLLHAADQLDELYADVLMLAGLSAAAVGARFGPWGALIGGLLGVGIAAALAEKYASISLRIRALRELGGVLGSFTTPKLAIQAAFSGTLQSFPDIGAAFFDTPQAVDFVLQYKELRRHITNDVARVLDVASMAMSLAAQDLRAAADDAAQVGQRWLYVKAARTANRLTEQVFGDQLRKLEELRGQLSPLSQAMEGWFLHGGFQAVGEVLIKFVDELGAHWARERQAGHEESTLITPTSGAKVLERYRDATLVRVRVPQLRIQARQRDLTPELVKRIADEFKRAVEQAYLSGEHVLRPAAG